MAIYTKLDKEKINSILSNYNLGNLKKFEGIKEGIENTNYSIETDKGKYILTIYEKRVNAHDLPFFSELMLGLSNKNFICPKPISNKNNVHISDFQNKKFMIVSCLEGKSKKNLSPLECKIVGKESAKLHGITKNFNFKRQNDLSVNSWRSLFNSVKEECSKLHKDLPKLIGENLDSVEKNWPKDLPKGMKVKVYEEFWQLIKGRIHILLI